MWTLLLLHIPVYSSTFRKSDYVFEVTGDMNGAFGRYAGGETLYFRI